VPPRPTPAHPPPRLHDLRGLARPTLLGTASAPSPADAGSQALPLPIPVGLPVLRGALLPWSRRAEGGRGLVALRLSCLTGGAFPCPGEALQAPAPFWRRR